jgi:allophanate hydrolase
MPESASSSSLEIAALQRAYASGATTPEKILETIYARIETSPRDPTWIHVIQKANTLSALARSEKIQRRAQALAGVPFAIKDNIDLAGVPTTAACPDFGYTPSVSASVVQRLIDAGAVPIGKTNLDQFATGLVGVRSPYGVPANPFNDEYIPGGSSSGSAVAVAKGLCSFSLGTDTAGSGRVPASFNGLVGLKPTRGLLSTRGVVPACRSLDCVSIFARTCADAATVFRTAAQFDSQDPFSRKATMPATATPWPPRIGVPAKEQLEFFGNEEAASLFDAAITRWKALGASVSEIDFDPFLKAARLLYEGAWVAERFVAVESFLRAKPESFHPVTKQIIAGGQRLSAADAFRSSYRLAELRRESEATWKRADCLMTPTAGTVYRVAEVLADPIQLNSNLGRYTNYMNLLDLCGLAVPAGTLSYGVPWGVTLQAPAFHDERLLSWGGKFLGETESTS